MSEHTREPWSAFPDPKARCWRIDGPGGSYKHVADAIDEIHARRIVACVNACAGMADPAAEIEKLKGQRDEILRSSRYLIKALSRVEFAWGVGKCGPLDSKSCYIPDIKNGMNQVRAAIAEIEGGE